MKDRVAIQYLEETCTWLKKMKEELEEEIKEMLKRREEIMRELKNSRLNNEKSNQDDTPRRIK